MELGRSGSSDAVAELVRIAASGEWNPPILRKKHWYSAPAEIHDKSSYENQLIAIAALGESKSKSALAYLKQFGEWRFGQGTTGHPLGGDSPTGVYSLSFKYATGPLLYRLEVSNIRGIDPREIKRIGLEAYMKAHGPESQFGWRFLERDYLVIAAAIEKLTTTVKSAP